MSSIIEKLQQIKDYKDDIVDTLANLGLQGTAMSSVAANVSATVNLTYDISSTAIELSSKIDEISALADEISAEAEQISAKAEDAFEKSTTSYYANYITQDMAGFLCVDFPGYYPTGSLARSKYSNYVSYIYQAKEDFDIWGEQADLSTSSSQYQFKCMTIYDLGYMPYTSGKGQRYRVNANGTANIPAQPTKGDAQYPTVDNPYHVSAGQYIVFSHDMAIATGGKYSPFLWRTSIPMPYGDIIAGSISLKYQKTDIRTENNVDYPLSSKTNSSIVESLYLDVPARNGFVEWSLQHVVCLSGTTGNANNWHLGIVSDRNNTKMLKTELTRTGEIEMAIQLQDRPDFIGGIAHGDEVMTSFSLSVDGKPVELSSFLNDWTQCKTVSFYQSSRLYDPSLSINLTSVTEDTPYVATHSKILNFYKDTLSIDQTIEWNDSFQIFRAYMPMITPKKYEVINGLSSVITDGFFTPLSSYDLPHDWESHTIPSYNINNINKCVVYGKEKQIFMIADCTQYINDAKISTMLTIQDNGGNNYNKCYFNLKGDPRANTVNVGDVWTSHSVMSIVA